MGADDLVMQGAKELPNMIIWDFCASFGIADYLSSLADWRISGHGMDRWPPFTSVYNI